MTKEEALELKEIALKIDNDKIKAQTLSEVFKYREQLFDIDTLEELLDTAGYKTRKVILKHIVRSEILFSKDISEKQLRKFQEILENEPDAKIRTEYYLSLINKATDFPVELLKQVAKEADTEVRVAVLVKSFGYFFDDRNKIIEIFKNDPNFQVQELLDTYKNPVKILVSSEVSKANKQALIETVLLSFSPQETEKILVEAYNKGDKKVKELIVKAIPGFEDEKILDTFRNIFEKVSKIEINDFTYFFFYNLMRGYKHLDQELLRIHFEKLENEFNLFDNAQSIAHIKNIFNVMPFEYLESNQKVLNLINSWLDSNDTEMISSVFSIASKYMVAEQLTKYIDSWINSKSETLIKYALTIMSKSYNILQTYYLKYQDRIYEFLVESKYSSTLQKKALNIIKKMLKLDIKQKTDIISEEYLMHIYKNAPSQTKSLLDELYKSAIKEPQKGYNNRIIQAFGYEETLETAV